MIEMTAEDCARIAESVQDIHGINSATAQRIRAAADTGVSFPMLLWCPACGERHVDEGEHDDKHHHTHTCQHCGMVWRPAIVYTTGVRFLPGFKNADPV